MQIFTFKVSDKIRTHGKSKINLEVIVVLNNVQTFKKQLIAAADIFNQKEDFAFRCCKYLSKANFHRQEAQIHIEANDLLEFINMIRNKTENAFYEDRATYCEKFSNLTNSIQVGIENTSFLSLEADFVKFTDWYKQSVARKIDMCEKLQSLNNKPLNAIIEFLADGYESTFTKYHLNLEHFSDLMHKILKVEFEEQHLNTYTELSKEHFELMDTIMKFESVSLNDYLLASDRVMLNQAKMDKIHPEIIKAQRKGENILNNFQGVVGRIYKISQKFDELYQALQLALPYQDVRKPFIQIMGLTYKMTVKEFFLKKTIDHIQDYIQLVRDNSSELQNVQIDKMLFSNLEKVEPIFSRKIKTKVLQSLREAENCSITENESQFMIKKNGKGVFDRNSFYTHTLIIYEFIPKLVNDVRNKYTTSAGYDKILIDSKTLRFYDQVFSVFMNKNISYDIFIQLNYYHINISSHYHSKVA